jgi:glycerol-3-phosphate responsive antiterminator
MLTDDAIPGDRNVIKKRAEKILIHKDLITKIQCMRNVKAKLIPVKIGATGTISKSPRQYLNNKPGKHVIKELQKTAVLGSARVSREVLMYESTKHISRAK